MPGFIDGNQAMWRWFVAIVGVLVGCGPVTATAQSADPYEGEAAVASQSEADRLAALPDALRAVYVQRTGDQSVADDPQLAATLADAPRWLQQYRYREVSQTVGGVPELRTVLVARFDPGAVDRALNAAGRTLWPEPRPQPVVWLAIDDGRGPRLLGNAQAQAVTALTARARQRGLLLTYPLLDLEDQGRISAAQVWAGDRTAAQAAAQRYQTSSVLLGRLFREAGGWVAEWRVLQDGEQLSMQRIADPDSAVALAGGADLAASALSARYAADLASAGPPGRYLVSVAGIDSAQAYARLIGQLRRMPAVREVEIRSAVRDRLLLSLELASGVDGFGRSAAGIGLLRADPSAVDGGQIGTDEVHGFRLLP